MKKNVVEKECGRIVVVSCAGVRKSGRSTCHGCGDGGTADWGGTG